jgi:hypothetical protein
MAQPVLTQRVGDEPWQAMFQTRGTSTGTHAYEPQIEGAMDYNGGLSYAPGWVKYDDGVGRTAPASDSFAYYDTNLPTVAELDARQAALLADPDKEYATKPAPEADSAGHQDIQFAAAEIPSPGGGPKTITFPPSSAAETAAEPQRADGEPAVW